MANIKDIQNLEPGYSVRAKLNATIAEAKEAEMSASSPRMRKVGMRQSRVPSR